MAVIATAWAGMVNAAEFGSKEEINAANDVFVQAQNEATVDLKSHYTNNWVMNDEIRAALSQPQDCGILNPVRSRHAATE
jgi:hypothetical protein